MGPKAKRRCTHGINYMETEQVLGNDRGAPVEGVPKELLASNKVKASPSAI